jgi:hypothetical protein
LGPIATGVKDNFLVAWGPLNGGDYGYSSYSTDQGATWSPKSIIDETLVDGYPVCPGRTTNGYLIATQKGTGVAYSSFSSTNGSNWSVPLASITSNITGTNFNTIPLLYTSVGTFVSANFTDGTGQISVTSDDGSSWQQFVTFTTSNYLMNTQDIYDNAPFMALGEDGIMVTWVDENRYPVSCFIPLSFSPSILPAINLKGERHLNQFPFQSQSYVTLSWAPRSSSSVIGS